MAESHHHEEHPSRPDEWRRLLTGEDPYLRRYQKLLGRLPTSPRCKLCWAPFAGPFVPLLKLAGFTRWQLNSQLCNTCIRSLDKKSGGAEVPVSVMYADIRGSTSLAEEMGATDFKVALNRFYKTASKVVDAKSGVVDHIAGDGIMALWIPAFTGEEHPRLALEAGKDLADRMAGDEESPTGVAVHTGTAYVGVVGDLGAKDFTVLGDVPNTVARLASAASPGELLVSGALVDAVGLDTSGLEERMLELKGKAVPVQAFVEPHSVSANSAA